ncbi:hypothetical protein VaNZ11_005044, partial [Volvox africanus]
MYTTRHKLPCAKQRTKRLGLCYRTPANPKALDADLELRKRSALRRMLGIRLGRTSTLRASPASRTSVVALASLNPADSGTRKLAGGAASDISWRLSQLRKLVPGWTSTEPAMPPSEEKSFAATNPNTTSRADTASLRLTNHISPTPPSGSTSSRLTADAAPANDESGWSPSGQGHGHTDSTASPEQRTASIASTSGRGTTYLHLHAPYHLLQLPGPAHAHQHTQPRTKRHHHRHSPPSHRLHDHNHHHHHHHQQQQRQYVYHDAVQQQHLSAHSTPSAHALRHPTLRLIASRLRAGSKPGARHDGARLGLVVEGGGMRGCISGAMLMALHELGLTDVFDAVYGASAGAINATYFLAGQRHGLRIYHEDLTKGTNFLDFRNLFSGSSRPVMNIDFLIDEVMSTTKPLDWDAVLSSPTPLKVVASCLDSLQPVILSDFADRSELAEALKATAAVPEIAGPPRRLRGRTLVDAAVFEPVPVPSAIRDGCTHVLVLCTRPAPTRRSPWARRVSSTIEVLAKTTVLNAPYMRDAWRISGRTEHTSPAAKDEQIVAALGTCPHEFRQRVGAYVLPLYPEHTAGCHPLCLDPGKLEAACEVGHKTLLRLLGPVVMAATATATAAAGELDDEALGRTASGPGAGAEVREVAE